MAARRRLRLILILCCQMSCLNSVLGTRIKEKIYIDLKAQDSCFRLLNGTHQTGCTSEFQGNVGVVHYIETDADWDWVLKLGNTPPYGVVLHSENFTAHNVLKLKSSGRVNGIVVIDVNLTAPADGFSADKTCPNDAYGLYHDKAQYRDCQKVGNASGWNTAGQGLLFEDIGMPVFSLTEQKEADSIIECYYKFNRPLDGKPKSYPLCAVEMQSFMSAAKDSETCIRRSNLVLNLSPLVYCDPLGDQNIVATIKAVPYNETRPQASVIVVAARMDTMGMFVNEYPSADTTVTGFVTLLATAQVLWKLRDTIEKNSSSLDIMFALFQGEAFDYIGSSRMVYDMNEGKFPVAFDYPQDMSKLKLQRINLTHIAQFIELSQVGLRTDNDSLWMHIDPDVKKKYSSEMTDLMQTLTTVGSAAGTKIQAADPTGQQSLPPASVQRFLMAEGFPSLVITDHQKEFTNKFYNSRFDLPDSIDAGNYTGNESTWYNSTTEQSDRTATLATTLARFLFQQSVGREPDAHEKDILTVESVEVNHLYYCYMHNPRCELFQTVVDVEDADALNKNPKPYPFYVSVHYTTNEVTQLTRGVLAYFTGQKVENATHDNCAAASEDGIKDERYQYLWMQGPVSGPNEKREGICYKSTVRYSIAKSPAFEISDYDWKSGKYSTWTESVWSSFHIRVFLIPSKQFQTSILSVGIIMAIISLGVVYFINMRADILFAHRAVSRDYIFDRGL